MSCRSTSRRRTWIISCVSTVLHCSGDHPAADRGSKTTGCHRPPVIGVAAAGLSRIRTSPRIPSRWRIASACRSRIGSRTGCDTRTSLANRSAPVASEASAAVQPIPQSRSGSGRGIERDGDQDSPTGTAVDPASCNDGSGAARVMKPFGVSPTGGASRYGCWGVLLGEGRSGTSHEGPKRPSTGSPRRSAKVVVHSR